MGDRITFERGKSITDALNIGRKNYSYRIRTIDVRIVIPGEWNSIHEFNHLNPSGGHSFSIVNEFMEYSLELLEESGIEALKSFILDLGIKFHKRDKKKAEIHNKKKGSVKYCYDLASTKIILLGAGNSTLDMEWVNLNDLKKDLKGREIYYKGKFYGPKYDI